MKIETKGRIKTWKRREEKWGIIVIETDTTKYDKEEGKVVDTVECFECFVGGQAFDKALTNWPKNEERRLSIDLHSDAVESNGEERYYCKLSIWKIEDVDKPSFAALGGNNNNDVPF